MIVPSYWFLPDIDIDNSRDAYHSGYVGHQEEPTEPRPGRRPIGFRMREPERPEPDSPEGLLF